MHGNYDNVASFYDALSRLVFGSNIVNAQVFLLPFIPANSSILIVGGGTGWILEEIAKVHPSGLNIAYVEISAKMTTKAKKRNAGNNEVVFINEPIDTATPVGLFDVVITSFLFDNFSQQRANNIFEHIHQYLKKGGAWLYTDFEIRSGSSLWQKAVLKMMYQFLGPLCHIATSKLPDVNGLFSKYGYTLKTEKKFFRQFIVSRIYSKPLTSA